MDNNGKSFFCMDYKFLIAKLRIIFEKAFIRRRVFVLNHVQKQVMKLPEKIKSVRIKSLIETYAVNQP